MLRWSAKVRSRHVFDNLWPTKGRTRGDFIESTAHGICGAGSPRSGERVRALSFMQGGSRTRQRILVSTMTAAVYFGELIFSAAVAIVLLATSTFKPSVTVVLFCCGLVALTLSEYIIHRLVLHAIAPVQHGIHHARPQDAIDKVFWQIWLAFAVLYLIAGGAVLAGALVAYAWYLFVHYCAHHNPAILPSSLLKHHLDHHRFANRNYGVTTKLWDRVFGTMLR
jgi:sterol desaturase/sphingolipid hydroxylase (fatty acid hydroxylase superfamily)